MQYSRLKGDRDYSAAKGMLTLNSADETDKSDNTSMSSQQDTTNSAQVTDSDDIMESSQITHKCMFCNSISKSKHLCLYIKIV